MDIIIRNGLLPARNERLNVGIIDGRIVEISPRIADSARLELDAKDCIVSSCFIDPHVHLDKCLTSDRLDPNGDYSFLPKRISAMQTLKRVFTKEDVRTRAVRAINMAVPHGTTIIRTNVEADPIVEFKCVDGILAAKEDCKDIANIQTVAFPQEGWLENTDGTEMGGRPYISEAMKRGIDIVGGNVNYWKWDSDPEKQVCDLFEIAMARDADIDLHLDNADHAVAFTLPFVAEKVIENGYHKRVTVSHIAALSYVPDRIAYNVIDLIKKAEINVCVLPGRIKLTRVRELFEAGVNVTIGTDNMQDAFSALGDGDMLKAMLLLAVVERMGFDTELAKIFDAGTINAARALGLENSYGIAEGKKADVVLIEASSIQDAIRYQAKKRAVIKNGKLVSDNGHLVIDKLRLEGSDKV